MNGYKKVINFNFDLICLDLNINTKSGFVISKDLREEKNDIPIIAFTDKLDSSTRITAWSVGIDKIIYKPFSLEELKACIDITIKRPPKNIENEIRYKGISFNTDLGLIQKEGQKISLRKMESNILYYLLRNKGKVVTRSELYKNIYNWDSNTLQSTIDVHVSNLRRKLNNGVNRTDYYIKTIHSRGFILN